MSPNAKLYVVLFPLGIATVLACLVWVQFSPSSLAIAQNPARKENAGSGATSGNRSTAVPGRMMPVKRGLANSETDKHAWNIERGPLTITVSVLGLFAKGHAWGLSVNSAGQAELTALTVPQNTFYKFNVSQKQMGELREVLIKERFFDLADDYGRGMPEDSSVYVAVSTLNQTKTVKLQALAADEQSKFAEYQRAHRVFLLIRGWIDLATIEFLNGDRKTLIGQ